MKEKLIMNRLESIELFSEETLSTMEIRGIIGGDGSGFKVYCPTTNTCQNGQDCTSTNTHCNCEVKAVAIDCGNGSFKGLCNITPIP